MISKYKNYTLLSDSLAKAIERVCKQKDKERENIMIKKRGRLLK